MEEEKTNHPGIVIGWDEQSQSVRLSFDHKTFRSWDMVLNVLETAMRHAKDQRAMTIMQSMQRAQVEARSAQEIRRILGM